MAMEDIQYREANESDIPDLARLRRVVYGTEEYWNNRISGYMRGEIYPQQALKPRVLYIAYIPGKVVGFIAGHLTQRFKCQGELEWINVDALYGRQGIALKLLRLLAGWFVEQKSSNVCVDVDPANVMALNFYKKHGALHLNKHWLVWNDISVVMGKFPIS